LKNSMAADREEEWEQRSAGPAVGISDLVGGLSVLCGHENPFDGWAPIFRIIPLRIDSLVEG
jgi:hypothetical protein